MSLPRDVHGLCFAITVRRLGHQSRLTSLFLLTLVYFVIIRSVFLRRQLPESSFFFREEDLIY